MSERLCISCGEYQIDHVGSDCCRVCRESARLAGEIVDAAAAGNELPEEWLILDTYADVGDPPSAFKAELVSGMVRTFAATRGVTMPRTFTMLDN